MGGPVRSVLAERLLKALMDWDVARFGQEVASMQMLASLKYDEYGGYRAGVKFAENLARWLEQFDGHERDVAFDFVMNRLVFISAAEIDHLIEVAYPDVLEPRLLRRAASDAGLPSYRVNAIAGSAEFRALRRRTLFLGLSDGARLDKLRRASRLSHEQFVQDYLIHPDQAAGAKSELAKALAKQELPGDATFRQVVLVDDFTGSGRTLIRFDDESGEYKGKLVKCDERLKQLIEDGVVSNDVQVGMLLYIATDQPIRHENKIKGDIGLGDWTLDTVQQLVDEIRVVSTDPAMEALCRAYYDPDTKDEHKADTPVGYDDCALPLVLGHNTPNNSVCLLWAETDGDDERAGRRALFPRYERHHRDRP
jgi:hypothetical protein